MARRSPLHSRPALEPDTIVRAALDLLDEVGFDKLSMRRLAAALGVANPALYWHFRNKQEIVDRMAQVLLAEGFAPLEAAAAPKAWEERLRQLARGFRRAMQARRDGARLVASADLSRGDELLGRLDREVGRLMAEGFGAAPAFSSVLAIIHYTLGATFEEQADPRPDGPKLSKERAKRLPAIAAVLDELAAAHGAPPEDSMFEMGVQLLLDGTRARSAPPERPAG
jgi:TetR/AcrR family transcriptional regulator, tetracycline repressor protein